MDEVLELGRQVLAAQPFSVLLGAEMRAFGEGHAEIGVKITPELAQQHGFAHGGVVSYLADNALTFAGGSLLGSNVLTSEYKINYLRPGVGDSLVAKATVIHAGKNQATCRCDVFAEKDGEAKLCATAQGTISKTG